MIVTRGHCEHSTENVHHHLVVSSRELCNGLYPGSLKTRLWLNYLQSNIHMRELKIVFSSPERRIHIMCSTTHMLSNGG